MDLCSEIVEEQSVNFQGCVSKFEKKKPFCICFKGFIEGFMRKNGACVLSVLHDIAVQLCNHMREKRECT